MKQTVLHQKHLELKAKMTDFQGWRVPYSYAEVQDEYHAVRTGAGLFDAGFLGRIEIKGPDADSLLQTVFTRNTVEMPERSAHYGFICNESGFILDDAILFRLADIDRGRRYLLSTNAINTEKILSWLKKHSSGDVSVTDLTQTMAQLALQGPQSAHVLQKFVAQNVKKIKPKTLKEIRVPETTVIISRTGFAGEYGYEMFMPAENAPRLWDDVMNAGSEIGIVPYGIANREILRIEAGYFQYGADIDENRTPLDVCGGGLVDFQKNFIGRDKLLKLRAEGTRQKLAGFVLTEKNAPRSGSSIFSENHEIGVVTSGAVSPSLRKGIGLGYVATRYSQPGQEIEIEIRDREIAAKIVELPFYRRK